MDELPPDCAARVRAGDLQAFEALYRSMHAPLLAFAARHLGDPARAEELIQDLFFDLWRNRDAWVVTGSVAAYLYMSVRNRCLNLRRRDVVEQGWADDEAQDDVRALHVQPRVPDAVFETEELRAQLAAAIAELPPRCAQIMQLRWHGGLSYAEIASMLGISVKGVENQLGRGLKALREAFAIS